MRIFTVTLGLVWALVAAVHPAHAQESSRRHVSVDIVVVQASRKAGKMDERLKKQSKLTKQIKTAGFQSARISDALKTKVEVGARVEVEVLAQPKARLLQVRVKEITKKTMKDGVEVPPVIKLTVGIKSLGFEIDTEHTNGGTIVVAHPQGKDAALLLAVTPKL